MAQRLQVDLGGIASIEPPASWQHERRDPEFEKTSTCSNFYPPSADDAVLSLYDRGYPISESVCTRFGELLNASLHPLSEEEVAKIDIQVLDNLGDKSSFAASRFEVAELSGSRALVVEGRWISSARNYYGFLIPVGGQRIVEVFFEGRDPGFSIYLSEAITSMNSIEWDDSSK